LNIETKAQGAFSDKGFPLWGNESSTGVESLLQSLVPQSACVLQPVSRLQGALLPVERKDAGSMGTSRLRHFVAGRTAARIALERLGFPKVPVPRGEDGEPLWPAGVCGSISHSRDLCLCLVASSEGVLSVGVDIEEVDRVRPELARRVMTPAERSEWEGLETHQGMVRLALVFSAKEAYFKFQYPITGRFLGFGDAEVHLDPNGGLQVVPLQSGPSASGVGMVVQGLVVAVLWE